MRLRALAVLAILPFAALAQPLPNAKRTPAPANDNPPLKALRVDQEPSGAALVKEVQGLDRSLAGTKNPNAIMLGAGNRISFCPALSCIHGPASGSIQSDFFDHQRASLLLSASTNGDGQTQEQTLAVTTTIGTGYTLPYKPNSPYKAGDNVAVGNAVYRATQAGTTAASTKLLGSRPDRLPFTVTDGTVKWDWINDAAINAKVGSYFETNVVDGAGSAWGAAFNYHINTKPKIGNFFPGVEFDYANNSGHDCALGVTDCTAVRVGLAGNAQVTHGVQITGEGSSTTGYSSIWALRINGDKVASQSAIEIDTATPIGLGFGSSGIGGGPHSIATIQDVTAGPTTLQTAGSKTIADLVLGAGGPRAIQINGGRSSAAIEDNSNSPTSVNIGGKKSLASIRDGSVAPIGILLQGNYSTSQIAGLGWSVGPDGSLTTSRITETGSTAPATSNSPCRVGQRAWDQNFEYRCVAVNKWKRASLSDW
ncbi:hypothetical protein [Methylorubrum extorquens]|jgi:hypothetical protein|uniref:Uncharacterized protein n=1 Tax=Methylorubrum extorquens DSM 13060 TaxID=882800 RepID=H1KIY7_METEX|nr:hypothetical protein [Methylorubrum extorquens]EHP92528.1 hypothetical protein MetexDRAFT_2599 [Methylorubrum extorquens DSM 13060]WIU39472.1 hypothetical protein KQ926_23345 [Methylorubrum extorquens]BDL42046.1 hypothetical protein MSPGM_46360 [Methylorubrum sp. GM97]